MKAIHLTAYGNPTQHLQMVEVAEPSAPAMGEVLVRMEYAPVDYSDLLLANGVYFLNPQLPSVIGGEGAGIVEALGPGVSNVKVGDRVTIPFRTFTWAEKVLAPADGLFVPDPFWSLAATAQRPPESVGTDSADARASEFSVVGTAPDGGPNPSQTRCDSSQQKSDG